MTPRGQMTRSVNSGPAVMMMPNHIRATFMPNPPLKSIPPRRLRRKHEWTGMSEYLKHFERTATPKERILQPTPATLKQAQRQDRQREHEEALQPLIEEYRKEQRDCGGEYHGMNCYNTLFVGRLAYEVTERKLLREMESYGPVKDIKLVKEQQEGRSKYAFLEYENEEDMKRAYRAVDGMKIEGREVVVDVERGHTVPTWLPRRLGGGLGGTRYEQKTTRKKSETRKEKPTRPCNWLASSRVAWTVLVSNLSSNVIVVGSLVHLLANNFLFWLVSVCAIKDWVAGTLMSRYQVALIQVDQQCLVPWRPWKEE
jgi:U1 small nuclear ribonucleoprotein 70kDa